MLQHIIYASDPDLPGSLIICSQESGTGSSPLSTKTKNFVKKIWKGEKVQPNYSRHTNLEKFKLVEDFNLLVSSFKQNLTAFFHQPKVPKHENFGFGVFRPKKFFWVKDWKQVLKLFF